MKIAIHWTKAGDPYRRAICQKYSLPPYQTVNGVTYAVITPETREALKTGEGSALFRVTELPDDLHLPSWATHLHPFPAVQPARCRPV